MKKRGNSASWNKKSPQSKPQTIAENMFYNIHGAFSWNFSKVLKPIECLLVYF